MGNTAGFMEYTRCENPLRPEAERVLDFEDLHAYYLKNKLATCVT